MKALAAALAAAVALTSITAQAANRIDTEGFSFAFAYPPSSPYSMSLLSAEDGVVRVGLENIVASAASVEHHDVWAQGFLFNASIAEGYRVTSMMLTGIIIGKIEQAFPTEWNGGVPEMHFPGHAWSQLSVDLTLHHDGHDTALNPTTANVLNGTQALLSGYGQTLDSDFDLIIHSEAAASARREEIFMTFPDGEQGWIQGSAFASIYADNLVLTFRVAAVPEPATYGMLIGGLGVLGFVARRPRRAASHCP